MGFGVITRSKSLMLVGCVSLWACNRDAVANQAAERGVTAPAPALPAEGASTEARGSFDESTFTLSITPKAIGGKGEPGELLVVLVAKAPFHVNKEYPHRFKVTTLRGVTTPSSTIHRDSAKLTAQKLEMSIPITLGQEGTYALGGELSFSVCTDEKCLIEKRRLVVEFGSK